MNRRFLYAIFVALMGTTITTSGGCSSAATQFAKAKEKTKKKPDSNKASAAKSLPQPAKKAKRIAAIVTTFFPNSHAGVIVDKFLRGFPTDEGIIAPRTKIVSLFIDQIHKNDIGRQLAHEFKIPIFESIRSALTLGGKELAVDGVLLIAEHGDYPRSKLGQEMLPRRYFFEQIAGVIGESSRPIPVYNDKHFSYRWDDAKWMYDTAKKMKIPLWAGSAMPIVWRNPSWDHPLGESIDEILVIGFHMVERYGYHALELLQCHAERRGGFESGVKSVQCLSGNDVWKAGKAGRWSMKLANAAISKIEGGPGKLDPSKVLEPHVFLIEYVKGPKTAILMLGDGYIRKFAYAQRRGETIDALEYHVDSGPTHAAFGYLGLNIEDFLITGKVPSPVERTYLTTGVLESLLISKQRGGKRVATPHLAKIHYKATDHVRRPKGTRPSGASIGKWKVLKPGATPAAKSIPVGRDGTTRGPNRK